MRSALHAERIWLMLAFAAKNRQLLSYRLVAQATGLPMQGVGHCLGPIQRYCARHKLPLLNVLVVSEKTGLPGRGYVGTPGEVPKAQAKAFKFDWIGHGVPSQAELRLA